MRERREENKRRRKEEKKRRREEEKKRRRGEKLTANTIQNLCESNDLRELLGVCGVKKSIRSSINH